MRLAGRLRRVHAHLLLAAAALVLARPSPATNLAGTALVAGGLALRVWAAGVLVKGGGLCTEGPYRWVRHPLYLGSLIAAMGFCTMMNVIWGWVAVLPAFLGIYAAQVALEERRLGEEFGEAHTAYADRVPMLVPRAPRGEGRGGTWGMGRVRANREHYHAWITAAFVVLFYLRPYWPEL